MTHGHNGLLKAVKLNLNQRASTQLNLALHRRTSCLSSWLGFLCVLWMRRRVPCAKIRTADRNMALTTATIFSPIKNVPLYLCPYLCQLLIDFQYSVTGTRCGQFAIIYHISHHTVNTSLHYRAKYKCKKKLTIATNINCSDQHCDEW